MKKYVFSLQKLLNFREFQEKKTETELIKAIGARDAIQLKLQETAKKRVAASSSRAGSVPVEDLAAIELYITRLDNEKEKLLSDLAAAELTVEQCRKKYIEASQARQVITKLKEKHKNEWHKMLLDEEADILDEIANARTRNQS
ncbi:flagellar export protein FliJ [Brucepastera parasyntrophica]|uniref:flagellar export protein FliJ n=1 Tax=Brucepastera parasyntrophica TaxID=2880008 RepID=UPI00210EDC49|nr:flagellar export protein FliJ [Brucepastera parasyntrophica]ULQ60154.1 flagellar export protein FliJ [Brucepastera parasyntrophica]